jgi:hypothetical protein
MSFSQEQRVFIVEHYFASRSYARVPDEFRWEYPDSAVPNNLTITRIINRFRECGLVSDRKRSARPDILTEAKLADVEKMLQRSPSKSLRRLSAQSGISYESAQKAMKMWCDVRDFSISLYYPPALCSLYQPQHSANRAKVISNSRRSRPVKIFKKGSDTMQVVTVTREMGWERRFSTTARKLSFVSPKQKIAGVHNDLQ